MRKIALVCLGFIVFASCKADKNNSGPADMASAEIVNDTLVVVFASCNDQERPQPLWNPIMSHKPSLYIWGGDNIYSDTEDMAKMKADYQKQFNQPDYAKLRQQTKVIGTWDDHDYGENDAGAFYPKKIQSQDLFLDFMEMPKTDSLRTQAGIFHKYIQKTEQGSIKYIMLDTRTYRGPLNKSEDPDRRYDPWPEDHDGWFLGPLQWAWLENELKDDTHDFTFIVSSVQFLNRFHGWEHWGNFPAQVDRMYEVLSKAKAPNIIILSGDRHHAEMSKNENAGLSYPLLDFTASGLTHTWPDTPFEDNQYRWGEGTKQLNFGVIKIHQASKTVKFEIRGLNDTLYSSYVQRY